MVVFTSRTWRPWPRTNNRLNPQPAASLCPQEETKTETTSKTRRKITPFTKTSQRQTYVKTIPTTTTSVTTATRRSKCPARTSLTTTSPKSIRTLFCTRIRARTRISTTPSMVPIIISRRLRVRMCRRQLFRKWHLRQMQAWIFRFTQSLRRTRIWCPIKSGNLNKEPRLVIVLPLFSSRLWLIRRRRKDIRCCRILRIIVRRVRIMLQGIRFSIRVSRMDMSLYCLGKHLLRLVWTCQVRLHSLVMIEVNLSLLQYRTLYLIILISINIVLRATRDFRPTSK